jgi:hypothetical protein
MSSIFVISNAACNRRGSAPPRCGIIKAGPHCCGPDSLVIRGGIYTEGLSACISLGQRPIDANLRQPRPPEPPGGGRRGTPRGCRASATPGVSRRPCRRGGQARGLPLRGLGCGGRFTPPADRSTGGQTQAGFWAALRRPGELNSPLRPGHPALDGSRT